MIHERYEKPRKIDAVSEFNKNNPKKYIQHPNKYFPIYLKPSSIFFFQEYTKNKCTHTLLDTRLLPNYTIM